MTKDMAIEILQRELADYEPTHALAQALKMAIEAMEHEPTTKNNLAVDCISRTRAIERLKLNFPISQGADNSRDRHRYMQALADMQAIRELPSVTPQEPRWIPVSERLPDTDDEVLCWYEYYHWSQEKVLPEYGFGSYFKKTKAWFGEVAIGKDVRVIAWMPLPKSYSEVEE